jgi:hypothetical protein
LVVIVQVGIEGVICTEVKLCLGRAIRGNGEVENRQKKEAAETCNYLRVSFNSEGEGT